MLPTKPNNVHMTYPAFLAQHTVAMTTGEVITWDANAEGHGRAARAPDLQIQTAC